MASMTWQFFPRSLAVPDHLVKVVAAFEATAPKFADAYATWDAWAAAPPKGSLPPRLESNKVLALVAPALEAAGYLCESKGTPQLRVTVLWKADGIPDKYYDVDARLEHAPGRETVVEIEAGGATANNAWRKDLMEACLMPYVDYLVIAVRRAYKSRDNKSGAIRVNQDFQTVTRELDALYESHRLHLPLKGILVIGY